MKALCLMFFFASPVWALDAVVTVLEAPMFKERSYDAPVVQYLRKGDVIRVHPSLANERKYERMAPAPEKYQALKKKYAESPEGQRDPLFKGLDESTYYLEDEFIPTVDRQGNQVYVLSDHIYVYFNDARELSQTPLKKDPTDYRLQEPLPKRYPLYTDTGHRGQIILGITQPYFESYPYLQPVKTKGYMSPVDFNFTVLRKVPYDLQDRFYFGGTFNVRAFENEYTFFDRRTSKERGLKFGLGPYISYDAFKGEKNRINVYGSINFYFFNQLKITQSDGINSDARDYRAYGITPRLGFQYHRKQILDTLDFVAGTSIEMETPNTFQAKNAGSQVSWWQHRGSDKFTTRTIFSLAGYLGIQTAY